MAKTLTGGACYRKRLRSAFLLSARIDYWQGFGRIRSEPNSQVPTTFRFTGQREQSEIGLYYYGARRYDSALGRWGRGADGQPVPRNPTYALQIHT
jgi:RHS repeat-associated protein